MALSQTEGDFLTLHELVRAAHKKLDGNTWDYLIGGTATETTLRRNRHALDRLALRPRVLRDVSTIDPSHGFLGKKTRLPVILAPIGGLEALAPNGGVSTARAASSFGVPFILSSVSEAGMQTVGNTATGTRSFNFTRGATRIGSTGRSGKLWILGMTRSASRLTVLSTVAANAISPSASPNRGAAAAVTAVQPACNIRPLSAGKTSGA
jgi:hypothetical protein